MMRIRLQVARASRSGGTSLKRRCRDVKLKHKVPIHVLVISRGTVGVGLSPFQAPRYPHPHTWKVVDTSSRGTLVVPTCFQCRDRELGYRSNVLTASKANSKQSTWAYLNY